MSAPSANLANLEAMTAPRKNPEATTAPRENLVVGSLVIGSVKTVAIGIEKVGITGAPRRALLKPSNPRRLSRNRRKPPPTHCSRPARFLRDRRLRLPKPDQTIGETAAVAVRAVAETVVADFPIPSMRLAERSKGSPGRSPHSVNPRPLSSGKKWKR